MKHTRKMVLVDYDREVEKVNNNLKNKETANSVPDIICQKSSDESSLALSFLDNEMNNILNQKNLSDSDKWRLYSQVLERYLFYMRNKQQLEENHEKQFIDILNNLKHVNSVISNTPNKKIIIKSHKYPKNKHKKKATPNSAITVDTNESEINISDDDDNDNSSDIEIVENTPTTSKQKNKSSPTYQYRRDSRGRLKRNTLYKTAQSISNTLDNYNFKNWQDYNRVKNELDFD